MKYLFIDESGVYNQNPKKLDPNNPVFLICGVIIDPKWNNELRKEFTKLKIKHLGRKDIVLHSSEFANPTKSKQAGIEKFTDSMFRARFYMDLNKLLVKINFQITGFVVHVPEYLKALGANQPDPYLIGVESIFDSYIKSLSIKEKGHIMVEARSHPKLNTAVLDRWKFEKETHGRVGLTTAIEIDDHSIDEPEFNVKDPTKSGLELVDLIAYHFARGLSGKAPRGSKNEISLELINAKMHPDGYFALPAHPQYYLNKANSEFNSS